MKRWNPVLCQVPWCPKFHQHEPPGSYREWCWTVVHQASGLGSIWDWFPWSCLKLCLQQTRKHVFDCFLLIFLQNRRVPIVSSWFSTKKLKKPCVPRVPRSATVHAEGVKDSHSHNWDAALSEKVSRSGCPQPAGQFQDEGQPWCRCSNFCQGFFFKHTYNL